MVFDGSIGFLGETQVELKASDGQLLTLSQTSNFCYRQDKERHPLKGSGRAQKYCTGLMRLTVAAVLNHSGQFGHEQSGVGLLNNGLSFAAALGA